MAQSQSTPNASAPASGARRQLATKPFSRADKLFYRASSVAAYIAVSIVALILVFLLMRAWPALQRQGINFVLGSTWDASPDKVIFQIGPMLWGSLLISLVGLFFAVPMALAVAYFIEFMANKVVAKVATVLIDLLAALPSVVIGLWGMVVFSPIAAHWAQLLNQSFGWLPFFANDTENFIGSPFIAGWIVAVMIVPIIASVSREIFSQIDRDLINGSLALGAGKASTFFRVILPTSGGGVVGGILLGLGRALGETVAIFFVLNLVFDINWGDIVAPKGGSVASMILAKFGEATAEELNALMASGLVLFIVTLLVNWLAAYVVAKAQPWRK
ncbi:MAG: hypothetical protein RL605_1104 [Actinomycetota bacterium]|mgnify:FL=1|jgi:phosphate transport system permease protein